MAEEGYEVALSNLAKALSADRAVVFQFSEGYKGGAFVASWGVEMPNSPPKELTWDKCDVIDSLLKEEFWFLEDSIKISGLDIETPHHSALVDGLGATSYLYCTISIGGMVWGAVGVHILKESRNWSSEDRASVEATALYIGNNLLKEALVENIALHSRIKRSKLLLQRVIDSTPVFMGIKDGTGKFILVNKALSEAAGYTNPRDMIGKEDWSDYFPPNSREEEGKVLDTEEKVLTLSAKGKDRWFTCYRMFVRGDNILPPMVVSTLVDITDLSIITRRLEDFTHIASHDLQEPLRTITSFLGLLKKRYGNELSTNALNYVDTAMGASKRMGDLLIDLLAYSRLGPKPFKYVPLSGVLMKALKNISGKLVLEVCPTIMYDPNAFPEVWGDEVQLIACIQNLLSNAIKFGNGSPVEVEYITTSTHWEVMVIDHGVGVPEGMEETIFKPFKRAHSDYEGTGMGLAIVEKVAHMHQGEAWATATPGGGTTIHVSIRKP